MNIIIPDKHRQEFDRAADYAVQNELFTPSELADGLGIGVFVASIMVGYMEKAELITRGKGDDVRRAKITCEQWEALGKRIENYEPLPKPEPEIVDSEPEVQETELRLEDIITSPVTLIKKTLFAENGMLVISDSDGETTIAPNDISAIFLKRGGLFSRCSLTFSADGSAPTDIKHRADTVRFKKKQYNDIKKIAEELAEAIGCELIDG